MTTDPARLEQIFTEALTQADLAARAAYLSLACGDDIELRKRIEGLLAAHDEAGDFLDLPHVDRQVEVSTLLSEVPGSKIGRYKLLTQIGEGGFGVVFMAEQEFPVRRRVALKIIKLGMDTKQVVARFEAERQALAMMDHPSIAKVLDGGATETGRPYFVMELVKGTPITAYSDKNKLSIPERLDLFAQVCQAVQHAHQKGLIHRDIKPSNVLVATQDDRPVLKIIDFGIAKATQARLTEKTLFTDFRQMIGTPEYMSPEQAEGDLDIDTRTDVYSLGVLLYELLAGSPPFDGKELRSKAFAEMQRIIREVEPPKPSTRLSTAEGLPSIAANRSLEPKKLSGLVKGELDWIVMKALEKDRGRRYETANGFAMDVQLYLHDEAVLACPPSARYRLRKFVRRHRTGLLATAAAFAALLMLVVGLAVSNRMIAGERNEKAKALIEKGRALVEKEKALTLAETESKRAADSFLRASIAIREVLMKAAMGQSEWSALPSPLRKRFSEEAAKFYETLLQEESPDPNRQYEAAVGHRAIATLRTAAGEPKLAEESFRRSVAILDRLVTEHPAVPQYRHQLGWSLLDLGRTLRHTKREEAKAAFQRAVELYETLLRETPNSFDYRNELASCYRDLSGLQQATRDFKAAEQTIDLAVAVLEAAVAREGDVSQYKEQLAGMQLSLGQIRADNGQVEEAKAAFRAAAARYEDAFSERQSAAILYNWAWCYQGLMDLPNNDPKLAMAEAQQVYQKFLDLRSRVPAELKDNRALRERFGHVHRGWAFRLNGAGRLDESEQAFGEARAVFEKLVEDQPDVALYLHFLADTQRRIARLMMARGRQQEAEKELRRSVELHEKRVAKFPKWVHNEDERAAAYSDLTRLLIKTGRSEEATPLIMRVAGFDDPAAQNEIAWSLATDPDPSRRNPKLAVELAERAIAARPADGMIWNTVGVARYRNGQWKDAILAFQKSMELRGGGDVFDWLFRAMSHWQLRQKEEARNWYNKTVEWMDKNHSKNQELCRFRAEAAELLGIPNTQPATSPASRPSSRPPVP